METEDLTGKLKPTVTFSTTLLLITKYNKMKSIKFLSLVVAAFMSLSTLKAQTADEVVNKHLEAIGGKDNWKKITSMVQSGSMTVQGAEVQVVSTVLHGKGFRNEITLMGMTGYQILTPTEGWNFMPFSGQTAPEAVTADDLKQGQDQLDAHGSLVDYEAKGHKVELLGKEDVDGTQCFKLKITLKSGSVQTHFIDPASYYIVKSVSTRSANGQEMELSTTFTNYQKLPEGIVIPMSISLPLGPGFNADYTVEKVEINKAVDESLFKPAK